MTTVWKIKPPITAPATGVWLGPGCRQGNKGIRLGSLAEATSGRTPVVWLGTAKEQVIGLFGKRGSGKSFTLGTIVEGLCVKAGPNSIVKGEQTRGVLLFDPLDIYWTTRFSVSSAKNAEADRHFLLAKAAQLDDLQFDVEAWVPGAATKSDADPTWFKVLTLPVRDLGLDEWSALLDVNVVSDPVGQALTDAINLVAESGYTDANGVSHLPKSQYSLEDLSQSLHSQEVVGAYHAETIRALRQRLSSLHRTGLFHEIGVRLEDMVQAGRLTVVLLGRLPTSYRAAIVAVLTRRLIISRSRVTFAEKRLALDPGLSENERVKLQVEVAKGVPKTIVALDEAQSFLAPQTSGAARDVFVQLVKEGRNIGLSAILATQQPSALDKRILSQIETFVAHQLVTEPDIDAVRGNLKSGVPEKIEFGSNELSFSDMMRMLDPGQCIISAADMNTTFRRCLAVLVRPRATVHGGIEL